MLLGSNLVCLPLYYTLYLPLCPFPLEILTRPFFRNSNCKCFHLGREIELWERVGFPITLRPYHVGKLSEFWKSPNHTSDTDDFLNYSKENINPDSWQRFIIAFHQRVYLKCSVLTAFHSFSWLLAKKNTDSRTVNHTSLVVPVLTNKSCFLFSKLFDFLGR